MREVKIINQYATITDVINKSRFIAEIFPVNNELAIKEILNNIKLKHPKARHYCYAYIINQEYQNIENQSDDGEPSKTAGLPMLEILRYENLVNVLIVVTRYFGGTLLGTGGLIKAYSNALKHVLSEIDIKEAHLFYGYEIKVSYHDSELLKYLIIQSNGFIDEIKYDDDVIIKGYLVNKNDISLINEKFNNGLTISIIESQYR
ncbi:MAG: YigZ family protein [Bacilli bacterium]|jgi:uncharacterized YigZ family protein|nr:YigZ family protein [Bacilli bacterium]